MTTHAKQHYLALHRGIGGSYVLCRNSRIYSWLRGFHFRVKINVPCHSISKQKFRNRNLLLLIKIYSYQCFKCHAKFGNNENNQYIIYLIGFDDRESGNSSFFAAKPTYFIFESQWSKTRHVFTFYVIWSTDRTDRYHNHNLHKIAVILVVD